MAVGCFVVDLSRFFRLRIRLNSKHYTPRHSLSGVSSMIFVVRFLRSSSRRFYSPDPLNKWVASVAHLPTTRYGEPWSFRVCQLRLSWRTRPSDLRLPFKSHARPSTPTTVSFRRNNVHWSYTRYTRRRFNNILFVLFSFFRSHVKYVLLCGVQYNVHRCLPGNHLGDAMWPCISLRMHAIVFAQVMFVLIYYFVQIFSNRWLLLVLIVAVGACWH